MLRDLNSDVINIVINYLPVDYWFRINVNENFCRYLSTINLEKPKYWIDYRYISLSGSWGGKHLEYMFLFNRSLIKKIYIPTFHFDYSKNHHGTNEYHALKKQYPHLSFIRTQVKFYNLQKKDLTEKDLEYDINKKYRQDLNYMS
jgi:hypothetical protein